MGALSQSSYTFFSLLELFEVPFLWVSFKKLLIVTKMRKKNIITCALYLENSKDSMTLHGAGSLICSCMQLSGFLSPWWFLRQRSSSMKTGLGLCKFLGCFFYLAVVIQPVRGTLD